MCTLLILGGCVAGGVNKYGYMMSCLLVIDDFMSGVPGAFMLCSSDAAEEQALFVRTVEAAINADIAGTLSYCCICCPYSCQLLCRC